MLIKLYVVCVIFIKDMFLLNLVVKYKRNLYCWFDLIVFIYVCKYIIFCKIGFICWFFDDN